MHVTNSLSFLSVQAWPHTCALVQKDTGTPRDPTLATAPPPGLTSSARRYQAARYNKHKNVPLKVTSQSGLESAFCTFSDQESSHISPYNETIKESLMMA